VADRDLELRIAWERHIGRGSTSGRWLGSVVSRYHEPQRHYHDVRHVRRVVRHVNELASTRDLADIGAVNAAAFFHDVIYDPTSPANEAASATLADRALTEVGWVSARIAGVTRMILGTAGHDHTGASLGEAVLYAADLAVLAADPAGYSDYVRNIRREYVHVGDHDWVTGRSAVLRSFLERDAIFAPVLQLERWERRARANITAELESLGA
jgi:predicted metal-dependent HD superfamily phosphohydrolase